MSWAATIAWTGLLASLRAGTSDFALRPERWETRAPLALVEGILREPLSGPAAVDALENRLSSAQGSAQLLASGWEVLGVRPALTMSPPAPVTVPGLPAGLSRPISTLAAALVHAHEELARAIDSLSPRERDQARAAVAAAIGDDPYASSRGSDFDAALRFDLSRLAAAGTLAAGAVDVAVRELENERLSVPASFSARWPSPIGEIIVSAGDADFEAAELARAGLIIRLGGKTRYHGPAAAAADGQVRVIIDLGGPAVIKSTGPAAGSADFGIGLLYLLGPGPHEVSAGELSLGAARFGVAYAGISGDKTRLSSRRFSQGAAAFGAGALDTRGSSVALTAPLAAQGYGMTLGAGLWRHRGDDVSASCGLELSDPREPLGFLSMCQGAGMGPRAFAAGGLGTVHISGDRAALEASYFAQGSGYWRGFGALFIRGDDAHLKARRYSLGTGTHAAAGALDIKGDRTRIEAWGVGPGFGWDYGVGLFRLRGNKGRLRSDWATGRADQGSRSLSWIEGDDNELALTGFGTGSYARAQAGYGLAVIKGRGNRLRWPGLAAAISGPFELATSPWGILRAEGDLTLDPALSLPDPSWPAQDKAALAARAAEEKRRAALLVAPRKDDDALARIRRLLFAASTQILDQKPAETAALGLASLEERDAAALARALDPDRFDERVWARLGAAGLGPAAARAAAAEAVTATGIRRAELLDWLRFGRAVEVLPHVEKALQEPDWRVRRQGANVLGSLFSDNGGHEAGRRRLLRDAAAGTATPENLGYRRLSDLYAALALAGPAAPELREKLLAAAGTPFDSVAGPARELFASTVSTNSPAAAAMRREEEDCVRLAPRARALLRAAAQDPDDEVAAAAILALGSMSSADDAALLASFLHSSSAARREAASAGLARLGVHAKHALVSALASPEATVRAGAAIASAQSWDAGVFDLLRVAFNDSEVSVRSAAVSGVSEAQSLISLSKEKLAPELRRMAASDPDSGVRASAAAAAAAITPAKTR